jgi:hypothetical protein
MPGEQFATLLNLLKAHDLQHLFGVLHEQTSLTDLQTRLASHRPLLLSHLQKLGVEKLSDRQALANALTKSEKAGQLPTVRPIPHWQPPLFDEDDDTITVWQKVPSDVPLHQLKVHIDANSLRIELRGELTACAGHLHAHVKPRDTMWELVRASPPPRRRLAAKLLRSPAASARARLTPSALLHATSRVTRAVCAAPRTAQERSPRPEYDPLYGAGEQPPAGDDTVVITLPKAQPGRWVSLFSDAMAKRYVAPPPPVKEPSAAEKEKKQALQVKKRDALHGIGFAPRKLDLDKRKAREAAAADPGLSREEASQMPTASAKEHWPSASASLLWREGQSALEASPDYSEDSGPLYRWTEQRDRIVVRAQTRRGLPASELRLVVRETHVECFVGGVPTPWCGHLVGRVQPAACSFTVVADADPDAVGDTLQLTLVKAQPNVLWRAPWPELLTHLDLRDKRRIVARPTRDQLLIGGWDQAQHDGKFEIVVPFKAADGKFMTHDDFRVAVTADGLNIHVAGQEDAPIIGGQLRGKIDVPRCSWRVRKAKKSSWKQNAGGREVEELVVELQKAEGQGFWRDLFKVHYV